MSITNNITISSVPLSSQNPAAFFDRGGEALRDKDLNKLKSLYQESGKNCGAFLTSKDLQSFVQSISIKNETDFAIMKWLLEVQADIPLIEYETLFEKAASSGDDGIPLMELIHSDKEESLSETTLHKCLRTALSQGTTGHNIIKWLLKKNEKFFVSILSKSMPEIFDDKSGQVLQFVLSNFYYSAFKDLKFTSLFSQAANLGMKGLPFMKIIWESSSSFDYQSYAETVFERFGTEGLNWLENACKSISHELYSDTFRWIFLKAASRGEPGYRLMKSLCQQAPETLSYWTFSLACQELEKSGNKIEAEEIRNQQKILFKDGKNNPDYNDIILQLAFSKDPSGYRELGKIPERLGWKPLTQEELNRYSSKGAALPESKPFDDEEEVEDTVDNLKPNQIRKSESALFRQLYAHIKQGNTPIKIEGSDSFKNEIFKQIRKIMSRPCGRWLLLFICRAADPFPIREGVRDAFIHREAFRHLWLEIDGRFSSYYLRTKSEKGIFRFPCSLDSTLFHELVHALHYFNNKSLVSNLSEMVPIDKEYDDLEEQYTIAGVDSDNALSDLFSLTQNTYHYERGYLPRYGHHGPKDQDQLHPLVHV